VSDAADSTEERLRELAAERARLWDEVQRLHAERREVEYFERRMRQMETSLSWRLTAPLRTGKTLAVLVRRKLRDDA
jgi:hypothetical protein